MERQHLSHTKNAIAPPQTQSHAIARSSAHPIEKLQGAIGNQAINQLLARQPIVQAKSLFRGLSHELLAPTPVQFKCISAELSSDLMQINEPIQAKGADGASVSEEQAENKTGLPDNLKDGIENLSGMAMDDVKVHYNSSKPSQIQALAHTQGTDIYVASGQEKHLPHEAWHVVQQMQGRVRPTLQAKGVSINDDEGLEHEADVMGAKALQMRQPDRVPTDSADRAAMAVQTEEVPREAAEASHATSGDKGRLPSLSTSSVVQRMSLKEFNERVQAKFPYTYQQFCAFFQQKYIQTEAAGDFLSGGIMYDWDWEKYVQDDAFTDDLLDNYFEDFTSRQAEQAEKTRISQQQLIIPSLNLHRIGSQELIPEPEANMLFDRIIKFMSQVHKQKVCEQLLTFAEAQLYLKSKLNERTIQVVLNSVSDSVRQKHWSQLMDIAVIHGQNIPEKRLIEETATRIGFEIEISGHFIVDPKFKDIAESLTNVTLASTEYLEFIIDDLGQEERGEKRWIVQIEFRTKPIDKESVSAKGTQLHASMKKSITNFPMMAFKNSSFSVLSQKLEQRGWTVHPRLAEIAKGLHFLESSLKIKPVQHVTHSLPIAAFLKLDSNYQNLLLPGSGGITSIIDLLIYLFNKIQTQVQGHTIVITTTGRNKTAPNIKTGLDTIIGLLDPKLSQEAIKTFAHRIPEYAQVVTKVGQISPLKTHEEIPDFPSFNPQGGTASLSGEEKLKPALFDILKKDIRVLMEHRGGGLVDAVNAALAGQMSQLQLYIEAFNKLDEVKGDPIFSRWFL